MHGSLGRNPVIHLLPFLKDLPAVLDWRHQSEKEIVSKCAGDATELGESLVLWKKIPLLLAKDCFSTLQFLEAPRLHFHLNTQRPLKMVPSLKYTNLTQMAKVCRQ